MADRSLDALTRGQGADADLATIQQAAVGYLGQLIQAIQNIFPNFTGTASSATAGAATLPANPEGFITISINGVTKKVPYYAD